MKPGPRQWRLPAAGWVRGLAEAPLALRVALASAVFALLIGALVAGSGYWALSRQLDKRLLDDLAGKSELVRHVLSEVERVDEVPSNGHRFGDLLIGHDELHLAMTDAETGRLLAGVSGVAARSLARLGPLAGAATWRWQDDDQRWYLSAKGSGKVRDGRSVNYVLSMDTRADQALLAGYLQASIVALPALLLVVAAGAWTVASTGLGPLKRFNRLAAQVTSTSLSRRLARQGLPAEIGDLADGFNAMLCRIDEGVTRLSEFSSDLAHEMRTPVSTLLGRTQVALSKGRTIEELREVLAGNVDELERLSRLIADMLFLAHSEHGGTLLERVDVDLAFEARRVADFLALVADERRLRIAVKGQAVVRADRLLVQRALTNLVSNALRHAESPSTVDVVVGYRDGQACVTVGNLGDPIPADQTERIFERLVRLDNARSRTDGGSGLGLAIVRSIMQLHGGRVSVKSRNRRTEFRLSFAAEQGPNAGRA